MNTTAVAPPITDLLLSKGKNTVGHETNLARSPLWTLRKRASHPETVVSPVLYGRPFHQVAGAPLNTGDQQLFANLTTMFVRGGCPEERRIPFSLGDAALALGHENLGGKQRRLVRQSLARLASVRLESAVRHPDGHETVIGWGLIDDYLLTTRGGGKGWVRISESVSVLLREGSVTFLHAPTWKAITDEDEVAGRLWSFLESEHLPHAWRYPLFRPEDAEPSSQIMPTISELLMLRWASRGEVAKRVRQACRVIEAHDRRYRLGVSTGRVSGNWLLNCSRTSQPSPRKLDGGLPDRVRHAWRAVYRSHLPSARQKTLLAELLERHTAEWIASSLHDAHSAGDDPFKRLLELDWHESHQRVAKARAEERRWEGEKRREDVESERSLAEILLEVTGTRTTD